MKPKLLIVFIALIALPLVILGWLGARTIGQERANFDVRIETLLTDQLSVYDDMIQSMLLTWTQDWTSTSWNRHDADSIREQVRNDGRISQFFVLDLDGVLVHPSANENTTQQELMFLDRTADVWASGSIHVNQLENSEEARSSVFATKSKTGSSALPDGRWHPWYWGDGLQLLYWWPTESGHIYGVELDRVRLLADIIGELPDTPEILEGQTIGVQLSDESGRILYQWSQRETESDSISLLAVPLGAPLASWTLLTDKASFLAAPASNTFALTLGLVSLALTLAGLGFYFYRENSRELREAAQRVSFVNHVSHELKTPLTNIRMYAELLQDELPPEQEQELSRLEVILSESRRLSRLITNVLTFNRNQHSTLTLHPAPTNLDDLLRRIVEQFDKSFAEHAIHVELRNEVSDEIGIDSDIVEQILGNLLSNVEKYARSSEKVRIHATLETGMLSIHVEDDGPGIPESERESVFAPFYRVNNELTEGVAGTGIGLSIARDLARLHRGDLTLVPSDRGTHFVVSVEAQEISA